MHDSAAAIRGEIEENLFRMVGRFPEIATKNDYYLAVAYTVRDRILQRWVRTAKAYFAHSIRTVCYLSAEFLICPQLGNNLLNVGYYEVSNQTFEDLCQSFNVVLDQ